MRQSLDLNMQPLGKLGEDNEPVQDRAPFICSINMMALLSFRVNTESIPLVIKAMNLKVLRFYFHLSANKKAFTKDLSKVIQKDLPVVQFNMN